MTVAQHNEQEFVVESLISHRGNSNNVQYRSGSSAIALPATTNRTTIAEEVYRVGTVVESKEEAEVTVAAERPVLIRQDPDSRGPSLVETDATGPSQGDPSVTPATAVVDTHGPSLH